MKKKRITQTISILFWSIIIICAMVAKNSLTAQNATTMESKEHLESANPPKYIFFIDLFTVSGFH